MKIVNVNSNEKSFMGMAIKAPQYRINSANDAIRQWEVLKHPKYTNIFQETEKPTKLEFIENVNIRNSNYNFLELLNNKRDKFKFIEYFKEFTGFPNLKNCSQKILNEFKRVLNIVTKQNNTILLLGGYDDYCSVGFNSALPGSDLDKGYAVIQKISNSSNINIQENFSNQVKGSIWDNIDNRLMSVNHCAAFPNIVTNVELDSKLDKYDKFASLFVNLKNFDLFRKERMYNENPISGSKFNIWLSERIFDKNDKIGAKNLAYIVETIRDCTRFFLNEAYMDDLTNKMNNSLFSWCSNVNQNFAMRYKTDYSDIKKTKLKARERIQEEFDKWDINKQYELVKDIIRSMSGDNKNPEFNDIFYSKTNRHRLLINDILCGDVDCTFELSNNGRERTWLNLKTPETIQKYADLDVYKVDY